MSESTTWYVLSNEVGTILAVYGEALTVMARDKAKEISAGSGCTVALHTIVGNRPVVGGSISMGGARSGGSILWF